MAAPLAYFDTSALVKRYVNEGGATRARALMRGHRVLCSTIAALEVVSAVARRRREGLLNERVVTAILSRLRDDHANWDLVDVGPLVLARAEDVVQTTPLRTLDAVHVASALVVQASTGVRLRFVTADARQGDAASGLGLAVTVVA